MSIQPESGKNQNQVTVDETVIKLNDEKYWLYAEVDADKNELLHTPFQPITNTVLTQNFLIEPSEKHSVDGAVFLIIDRISYKLRVIKQTTILNVNIKMLPYMSPVK